MVLEGTKSKSGSAATIMVKNPLPTSARDVRDVDLIPESGRSLEEGNGTHPSVLSRKIPWTEEPGRLQSIGSQRV